MKRLLSLMLGIVMVMFLCIGCEISDVKKTQTTIKDTQQIYNVYVPGTITDNVYKNESLNLKYTLVENMVKVSDEELDLLKDQIQHQKNNSSESGVSEYNVEYCSVKNNDPTTFLQVVSGKLINKNVSEYEILKSEIAKNRTDNTKVQQYKLVDIEYIKATNLSINGKIGSVCLKKLGEYYVVFLSVANSEKEADKLLSGFSRL